MKRVLLALAVVSLLAETAILAVQPPEEKAFEEKLVAVVPSNRQYEWQRKRDVYAFIHFGPNTFNGVEWGNGKEKPSVFNPTALDCKQWAKSLKSAGMTMAILTVKHHDGFCLWPSRYTGQSVKNSPWKEGKGDVVREFVDAIRAEGMDVGVYLSPADLFQIESADGYYGDLSQAADSVIPTDPASFKSDPTKARPTPKEGPGANVTFNFKVDDYNRYFLNQLYELLTEYGPVYSVWFDGATPKSKGGQKYAYDTWYELIRKLQPNACITVKGPDIRWVGNESGVARETEWSVIGLSKPEKDFDWPDMTGRVLGDRATLAKAVDLHWYPAETNVSIQRGWFYLNDSGCKNANRLMQIYEQSVGRNTSFLLNIPPDKRGLFSDAEVAALKGFGELRQTHYGTNLAVDCTAKATSSLAGHAPDAALDGKYETYWEAAPKTESNQPVTLEITLPKLVTFNRVVLQEQITRSQRVEAFTIEAPGADGQWKKIGEGTTIGYKRIIAVPDQSGTQLRIRFDSYRVAPTIAEVGLYY
jgi:alpha-L-fucosidase